jgi:hypothetical protein
MVKMKTFPRLGQFIFSVSPLLWRVSYAAWCVCRRIWYEVLTSGYATSCFKFGSWDRNGQPLPWYTIPCIDYLSRLDWSNKTVCELGAGNSTIWWSKRAKKVTAIESDGAYAKYLLSLAFKADIIIANSLDQTFSAIPTSDVYVVDSNPWEWRPMIVAELLNRDLRGSMVIVDNADGFPEMEACLIREAAHWASFDGYAQGYVKERTSIFWF